MIGGATAAAALLGLVAVVAATNGVFRGTRVSPIEPTALARASSAPASPSPTATPAPSVAPSPTPTPILVPDPLDGLPVTPEVAARHPIAVMVDDLGPARPQAGFSAASIVWQAPAEGGIPRYMLVFGPRDPVSVGPVRSARYYYIAWAAEWHAVYVHVGGSPQAMATLAAEGGGQLVFNADEFHYGSRYLWRIATRAAPHNVYTDGAHLRALARATGAADGLYEAAWAFGPDAPLAARPVGGTIDVAYPANAIHYAYDRITNTYRRSVTGEDPQTDAATGEPVAPKNVVVMLMAFAPLNDREPQKRRLEAQMIGSGAAWIASNGRTVMGTWRKGAIDAPTRFFGPDGLPVTLVAGQTFVQVMPLGSPVTIVPGAEPGPMDRAPGAITPD